MRYVYILQSIASPERHYVGVTGDLRARLAKHNAGDVSHTSKFAPWEVKTYVLFRDERQAYAFEQYLKSRLRSCVCEEAAVINDEAFLPPRHPVSEAKDSHVLLRQLAKEVARRHILRGEQVVALAERSDQDDVLVALADGRVAEVT